MKGEDGGAPKALAASPRAALEEAEASDDLLEHFADAGDESISAKWGSLTAPLVPCLLMSREACSTLFETPWRRNDSLVLRLRSAAVQAFRIFDADVECQLSWCGYCLRGAAACAGLSAGEVVGFAYSFVLLLASLAGASSISAVLGVGGLVQKLYLLGCARSFICFFYDALKLLNESGGAAAPRRLFLLSRARTLVLSCLASLLLPKDVLALHMTSCLLFGFMECVVKRLFLLSEGARRSLLLLRDIGMSQASLVVEAALRALRARAPQLLALTDGGAQERGQQSCSAP